MLINLIPKKGIIRESLPEQEGLRPQVKVFITGFGVIRESLPVQEGLRQMQLHCKQCYMQIRESLPE